MPGWLQYWAEEFNLPESPDSCPLTESVVELRETVQEHVTFTNWDILWGLMAVHSGATNQWPRAMLSCWVLSPPVDKPDFTEATTHIASPVSANVQLDVPLHCQGWKEKTSTCSLLLPLKSSLAWGMAAIIPKGPQLTCLKEMHSETHG